jgi:hypothetical protein
MCTLCCTFRGTAGAPVYPPMMEPLATASRPSFILLGCTGEEAVHKSPRGEQAVYGQHPKLKLQNMGGGELKSGDTSPSQNTTMRALWRTASTSHFFACKVWIFRSFNGGVFLLFFMLLFLKDSWSSREGGIITFSKRGTIKAILQGGGVLFWIQTPSFLYPPPPASRNNLIFRRARDGIFNLKKSPFENQSCYNFTSEHTVFHKTEFFSQSPNQTGCHEYRTSLSGALWVQEETQITRVARKTSHYVHVIKVL